MIEGFSGHADRDGLLEWVAAMQQKPKKIMLVHGEPAVIASFQKPSSISSALRRRSPIQ